MEHNEDNHIYMIIIIKVVEIESIEKFRVLNTRKRISTVPTFHQQVAPDAHTTASLSRATQTDAWGSWLQSFGCKRMRNSNQSSETHRNQSRFHRGRLESRGLR